MESSSIELKGPGKLLKVPSALCLVSGSRPNHIAAAHGV